MNEGDETIDWYISETAVFTISKSNNNHDPLLKTHILNCFLLSFISNRGSVGSKNVLF